MKKLFIPLLVLFIIGCAKHSDKIRLEPEEAFKQAKREYILKHYDKAIEKFKIVIFEYTADKWTEEAQYLLAKSAYKKKDYAQAQTDYDFFINTYPRSRFAERAEYELAISYYKNSPPHYLEQTSTMKAFQELDKFISKYPEGKYRENAEKYKKKSIDKLAKKDLDAAKLYVKLGKPESALIYLKSIQENYPESSYSEEVATLIEKCKK